MFERLDEEFAALEGQRERDRLCRAAGKWPRFCRRRSAPQPGLTPPAPTFKPSVIERMSRLPNR
jgi:hypothetical protein